MTSLVRPPIAARVSLGVMVAAMIATPLFDQGGEQRRALANVVVLSLFAVGLLTTWAVHQRRALVAAGRNTCRPLPTFYFQKEIVKTFFVGGRLRQ